MTKSFSSKKWNISKSEGDKYAYDMIFNSLSESVTDSNKDIIEINELINSFDSKEKDLVIKYNNKNVTIMNYLKIVHKGIVRFIDDYENFGIIKKNNSIYVKLMEDYLVGWEIV